MDALTAALATALGCCAGLLAGAIPGLHANTVCAIALAAAAGLGPALAIALGAMAVAHAFSSLLPSTYLGAPGEDSLLSALPAHRMLLKGQGAQAVQVGLDGGLAGLALAVVLTFPYKWALVEPGHILAALDAAMPWVLGGVLVFLVVREGGRGWKAPAWAALLLALSGALGLLGGRVAVSAELPVASSPLLPLLSGLFGAPALLESLRTTPQVPDQEDLQRVPQRVRRRCRRGVVAGVLAAAATAVLPGMTTAVAAALAQGGRREDDARPILATLSAIALAQVVLAFAVLWLAQRARSGVASAVQQLWAVQPWDIGAPPVPLQWLLLACLASGVAAHLAVSAAGRAAARVLPRLPARLLPGLALGIVVGAVALLSGAWGMALFLVSTAVGLLPLAAGRGRIHLTGCLLVPVLLYRLGLA